MTHPCSQSRWSVLHTLSMPGFVQRSSAFYGYSRRLSEGLGKGSFGSTMRVRDSRRALTMSGSHKRYSSGLSGDCFSSVNENIIPVFMAESCIQKMEANCASETSVCLYQITLRRISNDSNIHWRLVKISQGANFEFNGLIAFQGTPDLTLSLFSDLTIFKRMRNKIRSIPLAEVMVVRGVWFITGPKLQCAGLTSKIKLQPLSR
jgi:hypothetical protein